MRLLGLELTRLRWRRAVLVLLAACLVVPAVVFVVTAWATRPVSDADLQRAEAMVEQERSSEWFQRDLARCERRPERYGVPDAAGCEQMMSPQVDWYLDRPQLRYAEVHRNQSVGVIVFVTGLLMLAATTFVGADWNSGSMSNQLLFEPRRWRVWLAKAGAVAALAAVAMAVILGAFWGAVRLLGASRDLVPAPGVVDLVQGTSVRAVLLAAAAVLGAYAVTMLFRSTVFTLGALFAVVIGPTVVMAAFGLSERWMPHTNVAAVLFDGTNYWRQPPEVCYLSGQPPADVDCAEQARVGLAQGVTYLGIALAAAVGASLPAFLRRDIP